MKQYKEGMEFWEEAGKSGYEKAYGNKIVAHYLRERMYKLSLLIGKSLGLTKDSVIIELGCGDGIFSKNYLSSQFKKITAYDLSKSAIERAKAYNSGQNICYEVKDITTLEFEPGTHYDCAFLNGILHHVKNDSLKIISRLSKACPRLVVLEPNGNIIRKTLELLPSYKKAGEKSFRLKELLNIFEHSFYDVKVIYTLGFVPNFLPDKFFPLFKKLENIIESNKFLNGLCSLNAIGFCKNVKDGKHHCQG